MVEKVNKLLLVSLLIIFVSDYIHLNMELTDNGHFICGGFLMLGISGIWKWAKLRDQNRQG
jgi:hypothetical protein